MSLNFPDPSESPFVTDEGIVYVWTDGKWVCEGLPGPPGPSGGEKGKKGEPFEYDDFSPEQLDSIKGEKGDEFVYSDFTPEQLDNLKGEKGQKGEEGLDFIYDDFTPEQLDGLKGEQGEPGPLTFDDFTPAQLSTPGFKGAKGNRGYSGQPGGPGGSGSPGGSGPPGPPGPPGPTGTGVTGDWTVGRNLTVQNTIRGFGKINLDSAIECSNARLKNFEGASNSTYAYINTNGSIVRGANVSSDARIKTEVEVVPASAEDIGRISLEELRTYEFLGEPDKKHIGVIAQNLQAALERDGIDPDGLGLIRLMEDDDEETENLYEVLYPELALYIIGYQQDQISDLTNRIVELETIAQRLRDVG